ncbi:hypothetical protein Y032_0098g3130 [Ancylostoma ceylanicum]|uniref:Uncharacterized protein n=1 Tax=Ancylostoma ceylanicum TaxID=53326 RepID=A0A016TJF2_9BILA|nr:hypothetical protein Y032_0098g3130 [Ancylostoma ceylanicum]
MKYLLVFLFLNVAADRIEISSPKSICKKRNLLDNKETATARCLRACKAQLNCREGVCKVVPQENNFETCVCRFCFPWNNDKKRAQREEERKRNKKMMKKQKQQTKTNRG